MHYRTLLKLCTHEVVKILIMSILIKYLFLDKMDEPLSPSNKKTALRRDYVSVLIFYNVRCLQTFHKCNRMTYLSFVLTPYKNRPSDDSEPLVCIYSAVLNCVLQRVNGNGCAAPHWPSSVLFSLG